MAAKRMGPRRLAQEAWRRFMTRNGARPNFNGLPVGQRIELAYKNGFDAGLTKGRQQGRQEANHLIDRIKADAAGQVLPAVLEGRSQRHQDFILLVQMVAETIDREDNRSLAASVVWGAMQVTSLPDDETAFVHDVPRRLFDYASEFTYYQYGKRNRPEWLTQVPE